MLPVIRNILAVIAGILLGSAVNMGLVMLGSVLVPPPEGVDVTDAESMAASMHMFEPQHFLVPFLAHALGTLAGAYLAARIATRRKMNLAIVIGAFFLAGGILMVFLVPAPTWFVILDLVAAYIPMAWLGGKLALMGTRTVDPTPADS